MKTYFVITFWIWCCGGLIQASNKTYSQHRSLSSVLNPLGIVKSARRLVSNGVHLFRENWSEGLKFPQISREDADDRSLTHILEKVLKTSQSFNTDKDEIALPREGVLSGLIKIMGMDSRSIGMLVLNILIFFAEMITSNMLGSKGGSPITDTRMLKENLLEWFISGHNKKVDQIIRDIKDSALPETVISTLQEKTGNQTACVQLLICKMSPFIQSIQTTLGEELHDIQGRNILGGDGFDPRIFLKTKFMDKLFDVFPDISNFVSFGDHCERRLPNCKLLKFTPKSFSGE